MPFLFGIIISIIFMLIMAAAAPGGGPDDRIPAPVLPLDRGEIRKNKHYEN